MRVLEPLFATSIGRCCADVVVRRETYILQQTACVVRGDDDDDDDDDDDVPNETSAQNGPCSSNRRDLYLKQHEFTTETA